MWRCPTCRPRVDLMNRMQPYLPLLLALSTSSPFWQAQRTGLLGYRLAAYRELPRTGLSGALRGRGRLPALHRHPGGGAGDRELELCLVGDPAVAEASRPWSCGSPTAAPGSTTPWRSPPSTAASCATSCRDPALNAGQTGASRAINEENGWRAQRYGIHGSFVDEATRSAKPVRQVLDEILALVAEDAEALGCRARARPLPLDRRAGHQRRPAACRSTRRRSAGACRAATPSAEVVDWLSAETVGRGDGFVRH